MFLNGVYHYGYCLDRIPLQHFPERFVLISLLPYYKYYSYEHFCAHDPCFLFRYVGCAFPKVEQPCQPMSVTCFVFVFEV